MEVVLAEEKLDQVFVQTAQTGYTREILFSTLVNMMIQVVCSVRQSIGAVYRAMAGELGVSKAAVYGKLNRNGAGALPGKSLVVLDPALGLAIDIFPCEDGHAQERSLLPEVLETVEAGDLWMGDRNLCTGNPNFFLGIRD
jgi:hypothetical protein